MRLAKTSRSAKTHNYKAMGMDVRTGRKFLHAGPSFGGSCLPRDTRAFLRTFRDFRLENHIVAASVAVNNKPQRIIFAKLGATFGGLPKATVGLLGLSYKPKTITCATLPR